MSDREHRTDSDSRPARRSAHALGRDRLRKLLRGESLETVSRGLAEDPYGKEVPPAKRERIDRGVMVVCAVLGGLTGAYLAYGMAARDFFVNLPFWKAAGLALVTGLGCLCAGVTLGCAGSFLVVPAIRGALFLTWPDYRLAFRNGHHVLAQKSLYTLFAVNGYISLVALYQRWDVAVLLWIYWSQSVFVAVFCILILCFLRDPGREASFWNRLGVTGWPVLICVVMYGVPMAYLLESLLHIAPHPPRQVFFCSGLIFLEMIWSFLSDRNSWRMHKTTNDDQIFWYLLTLPFYRFILFFVIFFMIYSVRTRSFFVGIEGLAFFLMTKIVTDQIIHARQLRAFHNLK